MADVLPADRRVDWEPGVDVGVTGGIDQYISGRTSLIDVTQAPYSADPTGASDCASAINSAITAATSGQVVYLPIGVYRVNSVITGGFKDSFTIRGAGSGVHSASSVTVGTGTKTFTVPSGLGFTSQTIRIEKWDNPEIWMQGTVSSYSGTTLTMSIATTAGSGTYATWKVHRTLIDARGNQAISVGNMDSTYLTFQGNSQDDSMVSVTGSPVKGDTQITLSDASAFSTGQMCQIKLANQNDNTLIQGGEVPVVHLRGEVYVRRFCAMVTNKVSNTITIDPPLAYDLPSSLSPIAISSSDVAKLVGVESLAITQAQSSGTSGMVIFGMANECWMYDVDCHNSTNYQIQADCSVKCEFRKCWGFYRRGGGSNGAGFLGGTITACLVVDSIIGSNFPAFEINIGSTRNAFIYNYCPPDGSGSSQINSNHGPHNSFNLYEGNIALEIKPDGYFGSCSDDTVARNWFTNLDGGALAYIVPRRLTRNYNVIGNIVGNPGEAGAAIGYGLPNIGNVDFEGTAEPTTGDFWLQWKAAGTLTTRTDATHGVITFSGLTAPAWEPDNIYAGGTLTLYITWNGGGYSGGVAQFCASTSATPSGSTVTVVTTGDLPALSTALVVYPDVSGFQEMDLDVENSVLQAGNYLVGPGGSGGSQESLGGDTISNSYAYTSTPDWWPGSLQWPPFDPSNVSTGAFDRLPASYRFINGSEPADTGNELNVTTLNVSGTLAIG